MRFTRYKISLILFASGLALLCSNNVLAQVGQFDINNSSYANPDYVIERDDDGYFIAVWTDMRDAWYYEDTYGITEEAAVYGRIFDPSINPVGPDFRISGLYENGTALDFDLLVLDDGRFVVTWTLSKPSSAGTFDRSVMMAVYDRNGEVLISANEIDETESNNQFNPKISRIPGNQYLITWQEGANETRHRKGRRFEIESGEPVGAIEVLDFPVISVAYQQLYIDEELFLVVSDFQYLFYFDDELNKVGEMIDLHASLELNESESLERLHQLSPDTLLIPFSTDLGGRIWFRLADLEGFALTETIQITDNEPLQTHGSMELAVDPVDGSFMLIWTDRRNSDPKPLSFSRADIYAQRFDVSGNYIGTNFKVNHEPREENQDNPAIINVGNRQFLTIWWEFRKILCLTPPVAPTNVYDEFYLTARTVDFDYPQPGTVFGWDSYLRERNRKCSNVSETKLFYNYPNPFNERTTLKVDLQTEEPIRVDVQIYDILGRLVWSSFAEGLTEGGWLFNVNMAGLPSGTYIARFTSPQLPGFNDTTKMLLIR